MAQPAINATKPRPHVRTVIALFIPFQWLSRHRWPESLGHDTKESQEDSALQFPTQMKAADAYGAVSGPVAWWHVQLGAIALLNLVFWTLSAAAVARGATHFAAATNAACYLQLLLSAGYMLGCAFRSVLPVYDIPRIVLIDSRLSAVMVGRSVATVAELCFATQWALALHRLALLSHSAFGLTVSLAIAPLIILAEICSWYSVLTTDQRCHMAENSLWGVSAALLVAGLLALGPDDRLVGRRRSVRRLHFRF
jgi:hypothetical protein